MTTEHEQVICTYIQKYSVLEHLSFSETIVPGSHLSTINNHAKSFCRSVSHDAVDRVIIVLAKTHECSVTDCYRDEDISDHSYISKVCQ